MKKRFLPFLMALSLIFPSSSAFAEEAETVPEENITAETQTSDLALAAETAVLMDAASGEVLYAKNADQKMYPASITKLMTILLALEHGKLTDEITFSHDETGCINDGQNDIKDLAAFFGSLFGMEIKVRNCYDAYLDMKRRKNESRTYFLDKLRERLNLRMQRDDAREMTRR